VVSARLKTFQITGIGIEANRTTTIDPKLEVGAEETRISSGYHNPISDAGMIRCSYFSHHVTDRRALASPAIEESRHIRSHAF
jgi:hypothetical protein